MKIYNEALPKLLRAIACSDNAKEGQLDTVLNAAAAQLEVYRVALAVCGADWSSSPGTVVTTAVELGAEFKRRMEVAHVALCHDPLGDTLARLV